MTRPGMEPRSPGLLANTLLIRSVVWYICVCVCVRIIIHIQTVLLYHNSSVWLDARDASS